MHAGFEFLERGEQRLGDVAAAERPEAAARVGILSGELVGQQFGGSQPSECCHEFMRLQGRHARGGHELLDLVGALDAGRSLDAARHVDAEGPNLAHRDADVERVQAAGEDDFAAARELARRHPSR